MMQRTFFFLVVIAVVEGSQRSDDALDACGLPTGYSPVRHCFNDRTHHTCCLLGPEARRYADASGNPIGSAASRAFQEKTGHNPTDSDLTPWCTCFGSLVCSYYADRFNDGTHIKLIYEPRSDPPRGAFDIPSNRDCEAKAREFFAVGAHGTPGISDPNGQANSCPDYDPAEHVKLLSSIDDATAGPAAGANAASENEAKASEEAPEAAVAPAAEASTVAAAAVKAAADEPSLAAGSSESAGKAPSLESTPRLVEGQGSEAGRGVWAIGLAAVGVAVGGVMLMRGRGAARHGAKLSPREKGAEGEASQADRSNPWQRLEAAD